VQGGEDFPSEGGRQDEAPADLPAEEPQPRLGRSRAWNRPALTRSNSEPDGSDERDSAEATESGPAIVGDGAPATAGPAGPGGPAGAAMELSPIFRNWSDPAASANTPERCHFLRGITDNGKLVDPQSEATATHRCVAFGEPLPLSLRQQELVCLQRVHVSCPRYLRGALLASESAAEPQAARARTGISPIVAAGLVLILVAALVGGAAASGLVPGLGGAGPTRAIVEITNPPSATPSSSLIAVVNPTASVSPSETPSAAPTATPTPPPPPSPSPSPTQVPTASPAPTAWPPCPPGAKGGRLTCLVPCPDQGSCYEYMIHVGDKLNEIAFYFGVTMADIWAMNPWLHETTKIATGEILRLPPPTK
jgi:hypothetical protein